MESLGIEPAGILANHLLKASISVNFAVRESLVGVPVCKDSFRFDNSTALSGESATVCR